MGRLFILTSGGGFNQNMIDGVLEYAQKLGWPLTAIDVVNQELASKLERYKVFVQEESSVYVNSMRENARKYLDFISRAGSDKGVSVETMILEGEPFEKVCETLQNNPDKPGILVITRKGEGEMFKDIFTALERKLLLQAEFPVLVAGKQK